MITTRDYLLWYNAAFAGGNGYSNGADFNGDATISIADFNLWLYNALQGAVCSFST
ncbi:hypothetical protein JXO59_14760 [candidate division KSB1 bacterium]|nr:hypothetical protein [candidate division KSB1 bacterium]